MRAFKTKPFARFAERAGIGDDELREAAERAALGRIDADLGGGGIKQRIARKGQGKSGGYRTIILFRGTGHAFFVYGFAKSDRDNIRSDELKAFRMLARQLLPLDEVGLVAALGNQTLMEIGYGGQKLS